MNMKKIIILYLIVLLVFPLLAQTSLSIEDQGFQIDTLYNDSTNIYDLDLIQECEQQTESEDSTIQNITDHFMIDEYEAAMYLNECIYTLTKIESSANRVVLDEEQYKLNNILAWEGVSDYRSVVKYRKTLQDNLNSLIINDIEKERFHKALERKKNSAARDAIFGAISGVQLNVNMLSLVSNVVLSSARAIMDYKIKNQESAVEFEDEMWKLKKDEMDIITYLRNGAFDVVDETFGKCGLSENMRLTESNVRDFLSMLEINDPSLRVMQMASKEYLFLYFPQYWCERGFAYVDLYEKTNDSRCLEQAWLMFERYKLMMNNCKMYRYDDNLGMIALYELKYKNDLDIIQKEDLIKTVRLNVKENGNALLYCVLQYIEMQKIDEAYTLLCDCLNDVKVTAKNEMVYVAAMFWNKLKNEDIKSYFIKSIISVNGISLDAYIAFLYSVDDDGSIDQYELYRSLQRTFILKPIAYRDDDLSEVQMQLSDPVKFELNKDDWHIVRNDYNVEIKEWECRGELCFYYNEWTCLKRNTICKFVESDKFFKSIEEFAEKTKYLEGHEEEVLKWVSEVKLDGEKYYYLDAKLRWDDVQSSYVKYNTNKKNSEKYNKLNIKHEEHFLKKFKPKYGVEKIELCYQFEDKQNGKIEQILPDYYGPICQIEVEVKSSENCKVVLCYSTDYIEEGDTSFRFWGIRMGDKVKIF